MRKITELAANAFQSNTKFSLSNTLVTIDDSEVKMFLHGNLIAKKSINGGTTQITLAGWGSVTTRERLNGLHGVRLCPRKGEQLLNGEVIDPSLWYEVAK